MWAWGLLTLLLCAGPSRGQKDFVVTETGDGFLVSIGSTVILAHTTASPVLYVGDGQATFVENHGNFDITEYTSQRVPMTSFLIDDGANSATITLATPTDSNLSVDLVLTSTSQHKLRVDIQGFPEGYGRSWVRLYAEPDERVYGAGEQYSHFDLRGRNYPIWTREQGVGRNKRTPVTYLSDAFGGNAGGDYHTTYFPQPTFVSSRHFYCHVNTTLYLEMDFGHEDFHEIFVYGNPETLLFDAEDSTLDVVQSMSGYLGHQPMLPDWMSSGAILGVQGGTDRMLDILNTALDNGVNVTGVWIQDWSGKIQTAFGTRVFWNWEWNPDWYPGLDTEIIRLRDEQGVRLLAYITGHLNTNGSLFQVAEDRGYFMKNTAGNTYIMDFGQFFVGTMDFTNPEAREWYKGVIKTNLIEFGFGGWMADFGEYIPLDGVFYNGETGETMHNKYSVLWAQVNREAVEEAGQLGQVAYYMRAGAAGSQSQSTLWWAGDQNVDFSESDGLPSTVPAALSMGLSGCGLTHFDIGGYTTLSVVAALPSVSVNLTMIRDEELFFRGAEMAVFTPVMRTHEGNRPELNFQVYNSNSSLQQFGVLVDMFRALKPYARSVMAQNTQQGVPMQRPLLLHYENDATTHLIGDQYLYGRDLLVAPMVNQVTNIRELYLPADDWLYLYDDTPYSGGDWVTVAAPLGKPPVFYKAGSPWADTFRDVAAIANGAAGKWSCDRRGCDEEGSERETP